MDTEFEEIKQYAPEFISIIAETAEQAVIDWMRANNLPTEVIELTNHALLLELFSGRVENGKLSDVDLKEFAENLPEVTEYIARLGGEFSSTVSSTIPRKDVITWQPVACQEHTQGKNGGDSETDNRS